MKALIIIAKIIVCLLGLLVFFGGLSVMSFKDLIYEPTISEYIFTILGSIAMMVAGLILIIVPWLIEQIHKQN